VYNNIRRQIAGFETKKILVHNLNFLPRSPLFMVGKAQKSHGGEIWTVCSNGVPLISVSAFIATFESRNADAPLRLLCHPKKRYFKTTITPSARSGWSVVRSASLAKGGASKKRPSPHLHKVPTRSNKMSPRTLQTALVYHLKMTLLDSYFCTSYGLRTINQCSPFL
jgi:hypothetical protein